MPLVFINMVITKSLLYSHTHIFLVQGRITCKSRRNRHLRSTGEEKNREAVSYGDMGIYWCAQLAVHHLRPVALPLHSSQHTPCFIFLFTPLVFCLLLPPGLSQADLPSWTSQLPPQSCPPPTLHLHFQWLIFTFLFEL